MNALVQTLFKPPGFWVVTKTRLVRPLRAIGFKPPGFWVVSKTRGCEHRRLFLFKPPGFWVVTKTTCQF